MNIKSVKLNGVGFKGLTVVFDKEYDKDGKKFLKEVKESPRHPVHLGLEVPFKDLRFYLLHVCDLLGDESDKDRVDRLMNETEVLEVRMADGVYVIKGEKEVFVSGKRVKMETPKIGEDDDFVHYETVKRIFEKIVEEVELYLSGSVKVSDEEVVVRWIGAGRSKEFDLEGFNALPLEERKRISLDVLEKEIGWSVLRDDELEVSDEEEPDGSDNVILDLSAEVIKIPISS